MFYKFLKLLNKKVKLMPFLFCTNILPDESLRINLGINNNNDNNDDNNNNNCYI